MKTHKIKLHLRERASSYTISVGDGLLDDSGKFTRKAVGTRARKAFVVSDPIVFGLYGERVIASLSESGFDVSTFVMKSGERFKSLRTAESAIAAMSADGVSRTDIVVALGGGVVGDLAGFVAALHLRGVKFFLIPTTLLAMVDASVGGKTGVNTSTGKNLVGAFHQPAGVLVDVDVLSTLAQRDLVAGLCEMVKHGILAGSSLFQRTTRFLENGGADLKFGISDLIKDNIEFKAGIVSADERESPKRRDSRSRKVLNLGHTLAHALEKVTNYRQLRHGEAVGHGLKFIAELSNLLDLADKNVVKFINDVVHRTGLRPVPAGIKVDEVLNAFRSDKKWIDGSLEMVLLKGFGKPVIRRFDEIPLPTVKKALRAVLR